MAQAAEPVNLQKKCSTSGMASAPWCASCLLSVAGRASDKRATQTISAGALDDLGRSLSVGQLVVVGADAGALYSV